MLDFSLIAAEALAAKGKRITFKHNSVFSGMELGGNQEDTSLIINQIAMGTTNRINILKNTIMPYVKVYKGLVNAKLATVEVTSKLSKYGIIEQDTPEIIAELIAKNVMTPTVTNVDIGVTSVIVPAPLEDIKSYVSFKNPTLDTMLVSYISKFTDDDLTMLWNKALGSISTSNDYLNSLNHNSISKIDSVLALFAIVTNIKNTKQVGVRVSEGSYLTTMDLLHKYLSDILNRVNDKINLNEKFDKLVLGTTDTTITVHSKLYDTFLESSTSDVILGLLYSGDADKVTTTTDVISNKDKYASVWDNAIKRENFRQMAEAPAKYRMVYSLCLDDLYKQLDSDDSISDYVTYALVSAKRKLEVTLNEKSSEYTAERLLDVDYMSREICGEVIFANTMLDQYLDSMYAYHETNNKLTVAELTTMSSIDMIIEYLFSQITIENIA